MWRTKPSGVIQPLNEMIYIIFLQFLYVFLYALPTREGNSQSITLYIWKIHLLYNVNNAVNVGLSKYRDRLPFEVCVQICWFATRKALRYFIN